jgi:ribosomal protein L11 methyltransferase
MPWLTVRFEAEEQWAEALADALLAQGALTVTVTDADAGSNREQAWFDEPAAPPSRPWRRNRLEILFQASADVAAELAAAARACGLPEPPGYAVEPLEEQDWVRLTQSQFDPIRISERLWIVPSWHAAPDPEAISLSLDPGLAFGTGSHPTTRLCLRWLDENLRGGESLLDYGCGSGILAIAAKKLGAGRVAGVDIDPRAIATASSNAQANGVTIDFREPHGLAAGQYDIVVANILSQPLIQLAPLLASHVRIRGSIVLAGILAAQSEEVAAAYRPWFRVGVAAEDEGWALLAGQKDPWPGTDMRSRTS